MSASTLFACASPSVTPERLRRITNVAAYSPQPCQAFAFAHVTGLPSRP